MGSKKSLRIKPRPKPKEYASGGPISDVEAQAAYERARKRPDRVRPERVPETPHVDRTGRVTLRNEAAMCTALTTSGEPCRAYAVAGTTVCRVHGGVAPQVVRAAKVRNAMATDWLMRELLEIAASEADVKVRLDAIKTALSRGGISEKQTIDAEITSTKKFELTITKAVRFDRGADTGSTHPGVVEAVVVDEERLADSTSPEDPVPLTRPAPPPKSAMLSQLDLQEHRRDDWLPRRGERNTPSEFNM